MSQSSQRDHRRRNRDRSYYSADTLAQQAQVAMINARNRALAAAQAHQFRRASNSVGTQASAAPLAGFMPAQRSIRTQTRPLSMNVRSYGAQTDPVGVVSRAQAGPMTAVYKQYIADTKKLSAKFTKIIRQRNNLVQGRQSRINFWR